MSNNQNGWIVGANPVPQEIAGVNKNRAGIIFPSTTYAVGAVPSSPIYNPNARGIRIFVTNDAAGGGTATVKVQVSIDGTNWTDLAGATTAALGAVTGSICTIYPGLTGIADAAGITINQHVGTMFRLVLTVATATVTASVGAEFLE
jgi:hypothetical protein